jgi:HSP20 family protein
MAFGYLTPSRRGGSLSRGGTLGGGSLFDLHRQMNRLFDDLFDADPSHAGASGSSAVGFPAMEVSQDDKQIDIVAELPGVKQEDVELTVEDGVLTLAGEKKAERKDEERGYSERSYGRFERRITLPSNIDEDACRADFTDGVLRVTIPKSAAKCRGRRIPLGRRSGTEQPANHNEPSRAEHQQAASEERRGGENQPS